MGCGKSKLAVSTVDTITKSKSSNSTKNKSATTPSYDDGQTQGTTLNGIDNSPNEKKKDDQHGEITKNDENAPEKNNNNAKADGRTTTEGTVVVEGKNSKDVGSKEETKEKNVDIQEIVAEKTNINGDDDDQKRKEECPKEIKENNNDNQETITEECTKEVQENNVDNQETIREECTKEVQENNVDNQEIITEECTEEVQENDVDIQETITEECTKEIKENNVNIQETITKKTSYNDDVGAKKNGSPEEIKEEGLINQNNEGNPKEENIPKA